MLAQVENSIVSHFSCKNVNIVTIGVCVSGRFDTVHECDRQIGVQTELPFVFFYIFSTVCLQFSSVVH